jgi:Fe-S-cluster containining protein
VTSPCAACTHRCCHNHLVTVSGYDAWLIASNLRLAPEQFLVAVPQESPEGGGFLVDRSGQTYDIALDKARARTREKPCVFWIGLPGGIGRCGVYPFRPQVCQTYPAVLHEGRAERREDVMCPRPAWRDGTLRQPLWRRRLLAMHVEHDIYSLVAARWNDHVMRSASTDGVSLTGYYGYVLGFYERFETLRARLASEEWPALCERWAGHLARAESPLVDEVADLREWEWLLTGVAETATGLLA